MTCERCYGDETVGEHGLYQCPLVSRRAAPVVWADDIPGGIEITNGICNEDGTPRRYYSKTEMREAMRAKGIVPYHDVFAEGGNKLLSDARQHDDWVKSGESQKLRAERVEMRKEGRFDLARAQKRAR